VRERADTVDASGRRIAGIAMSSDGGAAPVKPRTAAATDFTISALEQPAAARSAASNRLLEKATTPPPDACYALASVLKCPEIP
jgi:hypothetical protein